MQSDSKLRRTFLLAALVLSALLAVTNGVGDAAVVAALAVLVIWVTVSPLAACGVTAAGLGAAVGGLLLSCAYCFDRRRPQRYAVQVLFAGLSAALIDETIQLFIEGRAGMIADVWIDFAGVVTGALLLLAFYAVYRRTKRFIRK
ncbi:MAG: VanZ family protein [Ruminococcus sp.]|nr:VanZ family protein [Ruminococcus sp.]